MKLVTTITCLVILISSLTTAQKTKAELIFKDGTRLEGLGRLTNDKQIRYRKSVDHKKKTFSFAEVDTLKLLADGRLQLWVQVRVKNKYEPKILELTVVGKNVFCYEESQMVYRTSNTVNNGMGIGDFATETFIYLRKPGEAMAIPIITNDFIFRSFRKRASEYFADCPELADKIRKRELRKREIKEIIEFYNNHCV